MLTGSSRLQFLVSVRSEITINHKTQGPGDALTNPILKWVNGDPRAQRRGKFRTREHYFIKQIAETESTVSQDIKVEH